MLRTSSLRVLGRECGGPLTKAGWARVTRFLGRVSVDEFKTIDEGLRLYLGLLD